MTESISKVRKITRYVTEKLNIPYESDRKLSEQCEDILLDRVYKAPSRWGICYKRELESLKISSAAYTSTQKFNAHIGVTVRASYTVMGYRIGDVLFNTDIAEPQLNITNIAQTLRVNMVGIPFNLYVSTNFKATPMNIMVTEIQSEGNLVYMCTPAIYPHYMGGSLKASTVDEMTISEEPFYHSTESTFVAPAKMSKVEHLLVDPLYGVTPAIRLKILMADILLQYKNNVQTSEVKVIGETLAVKDVLKTVPKITYLTNEARKKKTHIMTLEFYPIEDLMKVWKGLSSDAKDPSIHFDFVFSVCTVTFRRVIALVTWKEAPFQHVNPTEARMKMFEYAVKEYVGMKIREATANKKMYSPTVLAGKMSKGDPSAGLAEGILGERKKVTNAFTEKLRSESAAKSATKGKSSAKAKVDELYNPIIGMAIPRAGKAERGISKNVKLGTGKKLLRETANEIAEANKSDSRRRRKLIL